MDIYVYICEIFFAIKYSLHNLRFPETYLVNIIDQHANGLLHPGSPALREGHNPNVVLFEREVLEVVHNLEA